MKTWFTYLFILATGLIYAQPSVNVSVQNLRESSGSIQFDIALTCTQGDTAFIGFSDLVFDADWTQFTNPTLSVTSLGNAQSRSGATSISAGFVRFGVQNNSSKAIYTLDPKFISYQYQFNDNVIALDPSTTYATATITITGYTGSADPDLNWITTGSRKENVSNLYTFKTKSAPFETESATLTFSDFPTLGAPQVAIKVFLEGPYNATTGEMNTTLNSSGYLPLKNPYTAGPWNCIKNDSVASIPNADVVDWVMVQIRETHNVNNAAGSTAICAEPGFLLKDGRIVDMDGSSYLNFEGSTFDPSKKQFVVIYHRNHLAIMGSDSLYYNDTAAIPHWEYDFTTGANASYSGATGIKLVGSVPMMIAGDGDSNGQIQNQDKNDSWAPEVGLSGYLNSDFDMNGQVQNQDKIDIWRQNPGLGTAIP